MRHETSEWTITSTGLALAVLFVYQKPTLSRRLIFDFHGGVGLLWFPDIKFTYPGGTESRTLNSCKLSVTAGAAADIYILRRLYIEVEIDVGYSFGNMIPYIYPSASIGWQF